MSKRDEDDMEVGMTTAERRRRRRRGGNLRIPSDNVPRRSSTAPPVVAPVPEDPALAMSIAYSFTSDGSEPIQRVDLTPPPPAATPPPAKATLPPPTLPRAATAPIGSPHVPAGSVTGLGVVAASNDDVHSRRTVVGNVPIDPAEVEEAEVVEADDDDDETEFAAPVAPEAASTMIDPPAPYEPPQEFEMKTREMSAVDLEALGLSELVPKSMTTTPPPMAPSDQPTIIIAPDAEETVPRMVEVRFNKATGQIIPEDKPPAAQVQMQGPPSSASTLGPPNPSRVGMMPNDDVEVEIETVDGGTTLETDAQPDVEAPAVTPRAVTAAGPGTPATASEDEEPYKRPRRERIKTVALSDDDLEEVREAVRSMAQGDASVAALDKPGSTMPGMAVTPAVAEPATPTRDTSKDSGEVMSVPDIDIQMLAERADSQDSQDVEIEVEASTEKPPVVVEPRTVTGPSIGSPPAGSVAPGSNPPQQAQTQVQDAPRPRAQSVPPPISEKHAPPTPPPMPAAAKAPPPAPPKKPAPTPLPPKESKSRGKPWFVDLFDEDYLRTLPFLTPQATQAEAEFVIDAMGLQPGAQVLDIGCGYGRHAMELAARGFHMVGLDISTPLLVRGGEESHRRGLTINFVRGDMRELDFENQFDGAYCLFSTFGYFDDETNKKTIANIARALKPGGRVMLEILNRDYVIADLPTRIWWEGEGCVVLEEVELNYFSSRIQVNRSVVFDDGRQLEQEISVRAYSLHEVGKLMHAAGFRVLEVSGGYQTRGRFFGNQSRHIIVLAERKDTPAT